jgi:hypothetical protein
MRAATAHTLCRLSALGSAVCHPEVGVLVQLAYLHRVTICGGLNAFQGCDEPTTHAISTASHLRSISPASTLRLTASTPRRVVSCVTLRHVFRVTAHAQVKPHLPPDNPKTDKKHLSSQQLPAPALRSLRFNRR